jgi:hypothetical protein
MNIFSKFKMQSLLNLIELDSPSLVFLEAETYVIACCCTLLYEVKEKRHGAGSTLDFPILAPLQEKGPSISLGNNTTSILE